MTAERHAALVEKVARAMCSDLGGPRECNPACPYCMQDATAALNVALEEAAKVADGYHRIVETRRDLFEDGNVTTTTGHSLVAPRKIAAAIRALISEGGK